MTSLILCSQAFAELHQLGPFRHSHLDPLGKLAPKNPILLFEILDHPNQFFVGRISQKHKEGVNESRHDAKMIECFVELGVSYYWDHATPGRKTKIVFKRTASKCSIQLYMMQLPESSDFAAFGKIWKRVPIDGNRRQPA